MTDFTTVAPILPVGDLGAALARYRLLGFAVRSYDGPDRYGFADRGDVSLRLTETPGHDPLTTASMVYLYVTDADGLHAEWAAADPPGRLGHVGDTAYGLREFAYVDPDGTLHRIGSPAGSNLS